MRGIKRESACCPSETGITQYTPNISTACHSIGHPCLPFDIYEGILLSAWVAVLYTYYDKADTGLLKIPHDTGNERQDKIEKVSYSSFNPEADASAKDMRNAIHQAKNNMVSLSCREIHDEFVVVWLPPVAKDSTEGGADPVIQIADLCKPRLMLVLRPDDEQLQVNLYSHTANPAGFRLCGIFNSLEKAVYCSIYSYGQKMSAMDILSDYDINSLKSWRVEPRYNQPNCLHTLINRHYHDYPSGTAISTTSEDVTYEELGQRSAVVAAQLRAHGVGEGSRVGFCITKSASAMVILIGILRVGAAYVAIDTSCPEERMANIIETAGIKHLVCEDDSTICTDKTQHLNPKLLEQGDVPDDWKTEKCTNSQEAAYIMFTSGSTGTPKGAVHGQQGVAGSILEVAHAFSLGRKTRFLQYASFSFDASICELFAPLAVGGAVCIPSAEERVNDLQSVIRRLQVTDASLTPVVVRQLDPNDVPALKNLYIGGDAPTREIRETWSRKVRLSNIYGTTETGVWDTIKFGMTASDDAKNIGTGIGATCWIVDPANVERPLPIGVEGEIVIQSPYIGQGYLNNPEKTSTAFIESPRWIQELTGDKTSNVYRTGDLARYNKDGEILFRGRQTGFVKIRGLRVDLGEIESCLNAIFPNSMVGVVVSELDGESNEAEIVAFIEGSAHPSRSLADYAQAELQRKLPSYMIPAVVIPIETMPLTESKKINRPALRGRLAHIEPSDLMKFRPGGSSVQEWEHIDPEQWVAVRLSHAITDILEESKGQNLNFLRGRNFPLSSVGLTSVQVIYLSGFIRRQWGALVGFDVLQKPGITLSDIDDLISNGEPKSHAAGKQDPQTNVLKELDSIQPLLKFPASPRKRTIFCTSITGFLGSYILRSLLECPDVDRVVGLVRAEDDTKGRERVKQQALLGQWWKDEFNSRIDIWTGDLSQQMLGLTTHRWNILTGVAANASVDAIIHNGARVHWLETFQNLKSTNVGSTVEILRAISSRPHPCPVTYVSGGYLPSPDETRDKIAEHLSTASGYDQTKYLSQLLMEEYNAWLDSSGDLTTPRAQTIQPGYIVGTKAEGIAHIEDFLWRLAYTVLNTGVIPADVRQSYIPVAGVDQIATLTVNSVLRRKHKSREPLHCQDGIYVFHFCDILSAQTGKRIQSVDRKEWFDVVRSEIDNGSTDHPFLPVVDWFEQNYWQFPADIGPPQEEVFLQREIYASIEKSVEYLVRIGYLPSVDGSGANKLKDLDEVSIFRRSGA